MLDRWFMTLRCASLTLMFISCSKTPSKQQGPVQQNALRAEAAASTVRAQPAFQEPGGSADTAQKPIDHAPDGVVSKLAGIRGLNVKEFVEAHVGQLNPDLADLETDCSEGQKRIQSLAPVLYGDLDGDGQEEAAVEGWSCLSGNGGADFWGVLKLMPDGNVAVLPIEPMPRTFKGRNPYEGLRGHIRLDISGGQLAEIYPTYPNEQACNNCSEGERRFIYRWDGHKFVLDDIIEVPPDVGRK